MRRTLLPVLSLLAFVSAPAAQYKQVVPGPLANVEGEGTTSGPFGYTEIHAQQVWRADAITPSIAVLFGMAYRPDQNTTNEPGRTYSSFTIKVGYSANDPASLNATFANNVSGQMTTVFSGAYSLPSQTTWTGTGPFNISWAFNAPFVYDRSQGNLLIEMVGVYQMAKSNYFVDATQGSGHGRFGFSGPLAGDALRLVEGASSKPDLGGTLVFRAETDVNNYPAALLIGGSNRVFGSVPLPFDLGAVGATGNFLYVDPVATVGLSLLQQSKGYAGELTLPVPNNPTASGVSVFGQCFVQGGANPLGIVTSNGYEFKIGATSPITGQVYHYDPNSTTGFLNPGGPVTEFNGVF